eukprot:14549385-Ditylum_brightwellii.AAC.1
MPNTAAPHVPPPFYPRYPYLPLPPHHHINNRHPPSSVPTVPSGRSQMGFGSNHVVPSVPLPPPASAAMRHPPPSGY